MGQRGDSTVVTGSLFRLIADGMFFSVLSQQRFGHHAGNSPTLFLKRTLHESLRVADGVKSMEHLSKFYIRNGLESKLKQDDGSSQVRGMVAIC